MKSKKFVVVVLALVLSLGMLAGCSGGSSAGVEKAYWSARSYIDDSNGVDMTVAESYTLNISGSNYQLTMAQRTTQDIWIDITRYGSLFGTCTVSENGDELVYKLKAPTRGIYANGKIEAVVTTIDPVWMDSDNKDTWPEAMDDDGTAPTKEAVLARAFSMGFGLGETVSDITVTVTKDGGQITSVKAG